MKLVIDPDHNQLEVQKPVEPQRSKRHTPKATTLPVAGIENEEDIIYTSTKITPTTFMKICPALLVQIDQDACAQIVEDEGPERRQEAYYICKMMPISYRFPIYIENVFHFSMDLRICFDIYHFMLRSVWSSNSSINQVQLL